MFSNFICGLTAIVTRLTATSRSSESVWSISQTHVVRPRCRARARAVIHSPRAALRKLVSLAVPIAANPSGWTCLTVASVASISASAA